VDRLGDVPPASDRDARAPHHPDGPAVARIGVLGGTFNPPHVGHLALARHALSALGLERVLLMPANSSPHKPAEEDPGARHRLRMCRLAIEADGRHSPRSAGGLAACALEVERGGVSYTVDTLRALDAAFPDAQLTLIVGADVALTLPSWREPVQLLGLADLAVALRAGTGPDEVRGALADLTDRRSAARPSTGRRAREGRLRFLEMPVVDASSSAVRDRVKRGEGVDDLVGSAVASYIAEHRLYSGPVEVGAA
jgi:nicotinate-nucleotide adenylyltransferase